MKKLFILICLLLACNLLSAKDKVFYEKKYKDSFLGFYESSNLKETNDYKYYIAIYDYIENDETVVYNVFSNDYDKLKDFFYKVREKGLDNKKNYFHFYVEGCVTIAEYSELVSNKENIVSIKEVYQKRDFGSNKQSIIDYHVCILE